MKTIVAILGTALSLATFSCGSAPDGAEPGAEPGAVAEAVDERAPSVETEPAVERDPSVASAEEVAEETSRPVVSFVPAQGCDGITGTWRGQVYSDPHGGYYEFTAQISKPDVDSPGLSGSIVARSWAGTPDDVAPPETCDDQGFHWTVLEDAAGQVGSDGKLSFGGTHWRVGEHFCGDKVTDYSLDQLAVSVPENDGTEITKLTGVMSDGAVWAGGMGIEMTRIACE